MLREKLIQVSFFIFSERQLVLKIGHVLPRTAAPYGWQIFRNMGEIQPADDCKAGSKPKVDYKIG